jgi:hypothetical protein
LFALDRMDSPEHLARRPERLVIDVRGPGEWIVGTPAGGRSLHVYRLARADWLVSEVGRGTEGRGEDLRRALAALPTDACSPDWRDLLADALDCGEEPSQAR